MNTTWYWSKSFLNHFPPWLIRIEAYNKRVFSFPPYLYWEKQTECISVPIEFQLWVIIRSLMFKLLICIWCSNAYYSLCQDNIWASQLVQWWKNQPANAGGARDSGSIPGLGRSPGGRNGNPLQYSCLGNSMDRGPWWAIVHGVARSRKELSDWICNTKDNIKITRCYLVRWPLIFLLYMGLVTHPGYLAKASTQVSCFMGSCSFHCPMQPDAQQQQ